MWWSIKRSLHLLVVALILLETVGCGMKKMAPGPPPPPSGYEGIVGNDDRLQESLFKGDQAVLSNQDIERILGARLTLNDRHRLAVLRLNSRVWWSEELADLETRNSERFLEALRTNTQLTQVRFMPPLLVPEKQTVPYLREAAARFQADLLLIYTTRVQTFRQGRLIGADEVKARCVVDSVLLDVRTGIVVHSAQIAESVDAKKTQGELNFSETVAKAEADATGKGLLKVADLVVSYLREPGNGDGDSTH
jgi:hypothetical protein